MSLIVILVSKVSHVYSEHISQQFYDFDFHFVDRSGIVQILIYFYLLWIFYPSVKFAEIRVFWEFRRNHNWASLEYVFIYLLFLHLICEVICESHVDESYYFIDVFERIFQLKKLFTWFLMLIDYVFTDGSLHQQISKSQHWIKMIIDEKALKSTFITCVSGCSIKLLILLDLLVVSLNSLNDFNK